jgi:hypothetical protein
LFIGVLLFANEALIVKVNKDSALLNKKIQKGVSGYVICPYMEKEIICARAVAFGKEAKFYPYKVLKNDAFALPFVVPKSGDKIVFGKDYDRILIIAPNQDSYLRVKNRYKDSVIISPDVLEAFIEDEVPTKKELRKFAAEFNIGRYIFVLDNIYEVDSFSFYAIKKKPFEKVEYKFPFFNYAYSPKVKENLIKYYKSLIKGIDD